MNEPDGTSIDFEIEDMNAEMFWIMGEFGCPFHRLCGAVFGHMWE